MTPIDAINNDDNLFNIPAEHWRDNWAKLHSDDREARLNALYFWHGVYLCTPGNQVGDEEYEARYLLSGLAARLIVLINRDEAEHD